MAISSRHIAQQIAELRKNLELIEVRKSEFVEPTAIPLQLVKTEEQTRARLAALEQQLQRSTAVPAAEKSSTIRPIAVVLLVAGSLALVAALVLLIRSPWMSSGSQTQLPAAAIAPAEPPRATLAATQAGSPTAPVAVQPSSSAPLPDVAPPLTTTVALVQSPRCARQLTELAAFLANVTASAGPPLHLATLSSVDSGQEDTETLRSTAEQGGADAAIWCTGDGPGATLHVEVITQRAAPEVFEPRAIDVPAKAIDPMQRAVLGILTYLRRDYRGAEPVLRTAAELSESEDLRGILTLLIGNSRVFRREYKGAVTAYEAVANSHPAWAFAWHNLGVGKMYASWDDNAFEPALDAFEKARRVDLAFDLSLISMARIYRWTSYEVTGNYDKALAACDLASRSKVVRVRSQGLTCTALTQLVGANFGLTDRLPGLTDPALLEQAASPYWAEPLAVLGLVEDTYWRRNQDQTARTRAAGYFSRYLAAAYDDVHLEEERGHFEEIVAAQRPGE